MKTIEEEVQEWITEYESSSELQKTFMRNELDCRQFVLARCKEYLRNRR